MNTSPSPRVIRPTALKRLKDTYRDKGIILPALSRHVMQQVEAAPHPHSHDYMHPSAMSRSDWCPRHDYYRISGVPAEKTNARNPSFRMENIFAEGHAIHGKYQTWLWEMGVLFGDWRCHECGHRWGALSPTVCQFCVSPRISYIEVPLRHSQYRVEGHADGAVHDLEGYTGLIEIKSIGIGGLAFDAPRLFNLYEQGMPAAEIWFNIKRPFATHLRQGQLYLWMSQPAYNQIVFIYESKFHQQTKEFLVTYNKKLIEPIIEDAREVSNGLKSGITPNRPPWAESLANKICTSCPYKRTCWNIGAPTNGSQASGTPTLIVQRGNAAKRRRALRKA
jgi:CRISPR/Cas system-associated exonuclease Cas4 (RecB family)